MEQMPTELALFLDACLDKGVQSTLELSTGEYGGVARFCTKMLQWDVVPGREECRGVTIVWNELACTTIAGGFPEICRNASKRGVLKDGHHELFDPGHPMGIGY